MSRLGSDTATRPSHGLITSLALLAPCPGVLPNGSLTLPLYNPALRPWAGARFGGIPLGGTHGRSLESTHLPAAPHTVIRRM
jgi:hypothetical protein